MSENRETHRGEEIIDLKEENEFYQGILKHLQKLKGKKLSVSEAVRLRKILVEKIKRFGIENGGDIWRETREEFLCIVLDTDSRMFDNVKRGGARSERRRAEGFVEKI